MWGKHFDGAIPEVLSDSLIEIGCVGSMMIEIPKIVLDPKKLTRFLCAIALLVLVAHVIALIMTHVYGHDVVYGLVPLFDIALEQNVPTYFSTLLLLFNGTLFL